MDLYGLWWRIWSKEHRVPLHLQEPLPYVCVSWTGRYAAERTWDYDLWPLITRTASCNPRQGPLLNPSAFKTWICELRPSEDSDECWSCLLRSLWQILPTDLSLLNDLLVWLGFIHACVHVEFGSDYSVSPVFFRCFVFFPPCDCWNPSFMFFRPAMSPAVYVNMFICFYLCWVHKSIHWIGWGINKVYECTSSSGVRWNIVTSYKSEFNKRSMMFVKLLCFIFMHKKNLTWIHSI